MWKLVIEDDEGKRTVVPLTRDDYTIGRKEGNTIRLTERNVSREHAKLHKKNGAADNSLRYVLEDLSSYNGVYVNGLRVAQAQELAHGDLVQIGDYRIILQDDTATEAEQAVALDSEDLKATMPQLAGLPLKAQTILESPNRLIMLAGPTPGTEYPLVGERLTVGRAEDASISINHNSVSRLHCEIHSLGEGRFEIVDKGSSNGVRVNGADLKRGIIEAGDVIELGDVKFKFVGAGQIFRPGASESQQLAAIGNRTAGLVTGERRQGGSILPYVALGVFVGIGVAAWLYLRPKAPTTVAPPPPIASVSATPMNADAATLQDAKRICDSGDCETAHQRVSQLPDDSPLRQSQDFKDIEYKWAVGTLLRADSEPDLNTKRALLERVVGTQTVDPAIRKNAADKLAQIDVSGPLLTLGAKDGGKAPVASAVAPTPHTPHASDNTPAPPPAPHPTPQPRPQAPASPSPFDLATSSNPADWQKARNILEPRVFAGHASSAEVRLLKSICKQQGDRTCVEACKQFE